MEEEKKVNWADMICAPVVLIALFFVKAYPVFWLAYGAACLVYVVINWKKKLYGQACINVVAAVIAVKNCFM
jgi:hypothetical protein